MKLNYFLTGALAVAMMASCSDKLAEVGTESPYENSGEGGAFLNLGINLPTGQATTRAIGDKGDNYGEFNDGDEYEYTVESAILVIFSGQGTEEDNYVLRSAYNIQNGNWNTSSETQVTTSRQIVQEINKNNMETDDELYALVILNHHEFFEVGAMHPNDLYYGKADVKDNDLIGMTFGNFKKLTVNETNRKYDAHSFMMTNMPYCNVAGGTNGDVSKLSSAVMKNLYKIDKKKVYMSRQEAAKDEKAAVTVNVERVLAKVDVHWDAAKAFATEDSYKYPAEILGWFVDNTNPTAYVVRNFRESDPVKPIPSTNGPLTYLTYKNSNNSAFRFVSANQVYAGSELYRTFWAIDPNYDEHCYPEKGLGLVTEQGHGVECTEMVFDDKNERVSGRLRANGTKYYCTENTFDVFHQSEYNTTRVVIAAKFNEGKPFFTIDVEPGKIFEPTAAKEYVLSLFMKRVNIQQWLQKYIKPEKYTGADKGTQFFTIYAKYQNGVVTSDPTTETSMPQETFAGRITVLAKLNEELLTAENLLSSADAAAAKANWESNLANNEEYLASNFHAEYHAGGIAYYSALIQHFGEHETPWKAEEAMTNSTLGVYGKDKKPAATKDGLDCPAYLGRYGVVRNNWYDVAVTGLRQVGSSTVPPLNPPSDPENPDTPDDKVTHHISLKINVTPWVLRKQSVVL